MSPQTHYRPTIDLSANPPGKGDRSRHTSRAARRVEYHCLHTWRPGVEESEATRRAAAKKGECGSLLSPSVGATRRLVATTLQSKSDRV